MQPHTNNIDDSTTPLKLYDPYDTSPEIYPNSTYYPPLAAYNQPPVTPYPLPASYCLQTPSFAVNASPQIDYLGYANIDASDKYFMHRNSNVVPPIQYYPNQPNTVSMFMDTPMQTMAMNRAEKCRYQSKRCWNKRAKKSNGEFHSLCEYHRVKANMNQRKLDRKKRSDAKKNKAAAINSTTAQQPNSTSAPAVESIKTPGSHKIDESVLSDNSSNFIDADEPIASIIKNETDLNLYNATAYSGYNEFNDTTTLSKSNLVNWPYEYKPLQEHKVSNSNEG